MSNFLEKVQEKLEQNKKTSSGTVDLSNEAFPGLPVSAPKPVASWIPKKMNTGITDRFEIPAKMLVYHINKARQQLGKQTSASQVCKEVMNKFKSKIEYSTNQKSQSMTFLISGSAEAVNLSKKYLMNTLTIKVSESMMVPASVRAHIIGKGGATLKAIIASTGTTIQVGKYEGEAEEDDDIIVTITGSLGAIQDAKREIDAIVGERSSNYRKRIDVERIYHRLLAGANRSQLSSLEQEFQVKIHVPPFDVENEEKKLNEIVLVGDRGQVLQCEEQIKQLYEDLQMSTRTLSINVPKKQHRLIIGPKGSVMQEIFKKSGCVVEIPPFNDPSEMIVIRGPEKVLSTGLQLVLENANSMFIGEVDVATCYKNGSASDFAKFLGMKEKAIMTAIETKYGCTIFRIPDSSVFEFQSKSQSNFKNAKTEFTKFVEEKNKTITVYPVEVPTELHRFLLGKGGQNIQKLKAKPEMQGQLVDVLVPSASDNSEQVLVAIQRQANATKEADIVKVIKSAVLSETEAIANMVNEAIKVDSKFHGRLIGSGGNALKEFLSQFDESVNIRFPNSNVDTDEIVVRGPKEEVPKVIAKLKFLVKDFEKMEALIGHVETITVPALYGKRLVGNGGSGKDIVWIVKDIRKKYEAGGLKLLPSESSLAEELTNNNGSVYLSFELTENTSGDSILIKGPKSLVAAAKSILKDRLVVLQNSLDISLNLFEEISVEAKARLADMESGTKRQLIRQLIGKEGKGLRKILEEHDVNVHFAKENDDDTEDLEVGAVHIHGNKVGVAKVKKIFIDMMNEKVLNSFEKMFMVPQQALSQIVGRGGSNMVRIGQKHNVKIDFGVENDGLVECILRGPEEGCEAAQEMIMEIVKNVQDTIDLVVQIPIQLHRMIIGPSGSHIKEFINHFGMDNVRANFPKGGLSSKENYNAVTFTANESLHEEIKTKLEESIASLLKSTKFPGIITPDVANTKAEVTIPKEDVNFVCGKSFETLVDLMKKYGVSIWLKSLANTVSVIICGTAALQKEVNSVKSDLMSKTRHSKSIPLPVEIVDMLAEEGAHAERLLATLESLVQKQSSPSLSVSLVPSVAKGDKIGTISIKGELKKVNDTAKYLEIQLEQLNAYRVVIQMEFPSSCRGHIIGKKGQTINKIRTETETLLDMEDGPNRAVGIVVIKGKTVDAVELAKARIQTIVDEQAELYGKETVQEPTPVIESRGPREIPGFVSRNKLPPSAHKIASVVSSVSSMVDVTNGTTAAPTNEWKSIPRKGKVVEETKPVMPKPIPVPQPIAQVTPVAPVTKPIAPKKEKIQQNGIFPHMNGVEKKEPLPRPPTPTFDTNPVVDEWQTVNTGRKPFKKEEKSSNLDGIPLSSTLLLLAQDSNDTTEKKKKKKKKKAVAAAS